MPDLENTTVQFFRENSARLPDNFMRRADGQLVELLPGGEQIPVFHVNDPRALELQKRRQQQTFARPLTPEEQALRDAQLESHRKAEAAQEAARQAQEESDYKAACERLTAYQRELEATAARNPTICLDEEIAAAQADLAARKADLEAAKDAHQAAVAAHQERLKELARAKADLERAKLADDQERTRLASVPAGERPALPQTFPFLTAAEIAIDVCERAVPPAQARIAPAKAAVDQAHQAVRDAEAEILRLRRRVTGWKVETIRAQLTLAEQEHDAVLPLSARIPPGARLVSGPAPAAAALDINSPEIQAALSKPINELTRINTGWEAQAAAAHGMQRPVVPEPEENILVQVRECT